MRRLEERQSEGERERMKLVWEKEREEIESDGERREEGGGMMGGERQRDREREERGRKDFLGGDGGREAVQRGMKGGLKG